jgi:hypothetical protein
VQVVGDPGVLVLSRLEHAPEQPPALVLHGHLAGEALGPGHDQQEHDDAAGGYHRHLDRVAPEPLDHLHTRGEDGRCPERDQPPAWAPGRNRFVGHRQIGHGRVEGGRSAAEQEQDVPAVDRPARRERTMEDDDPEGGVGG